MHCFLKNVMGYILGDFFTNSSGHPGHTMKVYDKKRWEEEGDKEGECKKARARESEGEGERGRTRRRERAKETEGKKGGGMLKEGGRKVVRYNREREGDRGRERGR
jgi:hypothetical protein